VSVENRFEEPLERLRTRIAELARNPEGPARDKAIRKLTEQLEKKSVEIYANLTPWQKTLVARHPARPFTLDYVRVLLRDFVELHGDRAYADDPAIVAGFGFLGDRAVAVVGHQKGRDTRRRSAGISGCRGPRATGKPCAS
jgi:acetyl-CoA carboxylase carboxyl transferase subunit alpha